MVLQDNGGDNLTITANGTFTFKTAVSGTYAVTILTQPIGPIQSCTVTNSSGTAIAKVTNVQVNCGHGLSIGGSISGLIGTGMVLQDNGGDNLAVSGSGNVVFTFASPITSGSTYAVTILNQPSNPTQTCFVASGTGTVNGNVTNVQITCSQPSFTVSGSVVGLIVGPGDTLEVQDNAGDNLLVSGDGVFTFPTPVTYGGIFNVDVFSFPTSNLGIGCNLFFYTGIVTGNVSDTVVDCEHNDWNFISYFIAATEKSNNYAAITTPLYPPGVLPPANTGFPGGRDYPASWSDSRGRKWLFGGRGFPYPSPYGNQLPGFLNDLWVYDGTWIPANLPTFINTAGLWVVDPTPMEVVYSSGFYGTFNTATPGAAPAARWGSATWTDASDNLWMFGGQGDGIDLLNDVWEWIPGTPPSASPVNAANNAGTFTGQWIWKGGSNLGNQNGAYGTKGTASALNIPGGRWAASTFTQYVGGVPTNVWLFGGQGYDASSATFGLLGDLWEYNIASGQWTWVSGSSAANPNGVYGTEGTAGAANVPGGRQEAVLWVDASGNIWLFGGFGYDSAGTGSPNGAILNDLWEFQPGTGQWTWVSGGNKANQTGTYSAQATSNLSTGAAGDVPGSRQGAVGWTDAASNLWLYGGWGIGTSSTDPNGFLDDIWEYQHSTGTWIWWKGTSGINQSTQYNAANGFGLPFVKNIAGARRGPAIWQPDASGNVWIFGGEGYDFSGGNPPGYLDDLWTYLPFPN